MKKLRNKTGKTVPMSKRIAFSSVLCALGVVVMFLGSIFEIVDITMAAMASFFIVVCMIELGGYMPLCVFFATAALAFLLLPNKTVVIFYAMFFGFYPILKRYFERTGKAWLSWGIKLLFFNSVLTVYFLLSRFVLFMGFEQLEIYLYLLLNVIFVTLDIALTLFVTAYVKRFRAMLRIDRFFK